MATRYAKLMQSQGSARFLTVGTRRFTFHSLSGLRMLSEVIEESPGCVSTFPGYWRGQKRFGLSALERAGVYRRNAARERDPFRKMAFKRRCRDAIFESRVMDVPGDAVPYPVLKWVMPDVSLVPSHRGEPT